MLLYEFEGKKLFKSCGIEIPNSQLIEPPDEEIKIKAPLVLKAQVLSGKRADSGGIVVVDDESKLKVSVLALLGSSVNGEKVEKILVEEMVEIDKEYYLSFSYSTESRGPVMSFGEGGTGAEGKGAKVTPVDPLERFKGEGLPEKLIDV